MLARLRRTYAGELGEHLRLLFGQIEPTLVLDVGAHVGLYGQLLRRIGFAGRIVSFEPVERNLVELRAAAAKDPDWEVVAAAVAPEDAGIRFQVARQTNLSSFLRPSAAGHERHRGGIEAAGEPEAVAVRRIGSDVVPATARVFLKADTQGYDLQVIRACDVLDQVVGVQVELAVRQIYEGSPTLDEGMRALAKHGFAVTGIFSGDRNKQLLLYEADCVFRRLASE